LGGPVVSVTRVEYDSRPISVAGTVRKTVTFQATGNVTLLDAIARAEGLSAEAGLELLVSRPGELVRRIPVKALIDAADPDMNLRLLGGEEIRVPEASKIYVVGNVKKPGAFPVRDSADTSVLKVLALAEGLTQFSAKQAYIYRRDPDGASKKEIEIQIDSIMKRKTPDVSLEDPGVRLRVRDLHPARLAAPDSHLRIHGCHRYRPSHAHRHPRPGSHAINHQRRRSVSSDSDQADPGRRRSAPGGPEIQAAR